MPAPFSSPAPSAAPVPLPALYLYPLNDSFVPKHISLVNNQRVKIGRQTNAKTVPQERNGYFDSKVLSRQHAEVWEENGKIFIKDVKSSNGTFINGERLSQEGLESDPYELHTDDIVEFGIDIVGEDNKTIVHHKVAARVVCVFTELDAQAAHRAEQQQQQQGAHGYLGGMGGQPGGAANNGAFNFAGNGQGSSNGPAGAQRRPTLQPQGLVGMGGMGGNVRVPGKSGLTFDHILSRLHGELQKSRETGAELHSLSSGLAEIHETLGGNFPPNLPPYPSTLPPVVPPQPGRPSEEPQHEAQPEPTAAVNELQAQLQETQRSLADHVEKVRMLEGMLAEHQAIKQEVNSLRDAMEERKREMELFRFGNGDRRRSHDRHDEHDGADEDDDDTRSISTVVPHELEPVDEVDEEQVAAEEEEERRRRRDELGRPRTPEPTGMGMSEDEEDREHDQGRYGKQSVSDRRARSRSPEASAPPAIPDELTERLNALAKQLEMALELSRSLEAQHASAQSTISVLEAKVQSLETLVQVTQTQVQEQSEVTGRLAQEVEAVRAAPQEPSVPAAVVEEARTQERESLTAMFTEWKKSVEGRWSSVQEDWNDERERLRRAKEEWESRMRAAEETITGAASKVESGLLSLASFQAQHQQGAMNGNAKPHSSGGLVTPPSPRSLSAESTRPRQRRKRVSTSRGRTRSRSVSPGAAVDEPKRGAGPNADIEGTFSGTRRRSPWADDDSSDSEGHHPSDRSEQNGGDGATQGKMPFPITPESSVVNQPISTAASVVSGATTDPRAQKPPKDGVSPAVVDSRTSPELAFQYPYHNFSAAVGVAVLAVAAVAVAWRVKPEVAV
ncbi:hypothetical protein PYCCODRAFT_1357554 [Trametes coccinea BRFM310]|uniref:FHA domain-containing protein n=1 Tax=Trametes coccinea (strain BRFM310) TaxID=1353009 RepID=A0A1Y2J385_TRAC3|nr:hypothetical protein PYCCODRAFT_1357554 [Trametes coccinea BRFM310]